MRKPLIKTYRTALSALGFFLKSFYRFQIVFRIILTLYKGNLSVSVLFLGVKLVYETYLVFLALVIFINVRDARITIIYCNVKVVFIYKSFNASSAARSTA